MQKSKQISESFRLGILLALSGGLMDAYSYLYRGHVFANAQTGNLLLFGVNLSTGNFQMALRYLFPILAFTVGIAAADITRHIYKNVKLLHWRQIMVLAEAAILLSVAFFSQKNNLTANSLTSFACGIQVESFRKIRGNGVATTMCIGNLRTATQALCDYCFSKDKDALKNGMLFFSFIIIFVLGAVLGNFLVEMFSEKAIWGSSLLLFGAFGLMFFEKME